MQDVAGAIRKARTALSVREALNGKRRAALPPGLNGHPPPRKPSAPSLGLTYSHYSRPSSLRYLHTLALQPGLTSTFLNAGHEVEKEAKALQTLLLLLLLYSRYRS